jgi:hypothetical protein
MRDRRKHFHRRLRSLWLYEAAGRRLRRRGCEVGFWTLDVAPGSSQKTLETHPSQACCKLAVRPRGDRSPDRGSSRIDRPQIESRSCEGGGDLRERRPGRFALRGRPRSRVPRGLRADRRRGDQHRGAEICWPAPGRRSASRRRVGPGEALVRRLDDRPDRPGLLADEVHCATDASQARAVNRASVHGGLPVGRTPATRRVAQSVAHPATPPAGFGSSMRPGPVAQRSEQRTHNPSVDGSIPSRPTPSAIGNPGRTAAPRVARQGAWHREGDSGSGAGGRSGGYFDSPTASRACSRVSYSRPLTIRPSRTVQATK